MKKTEGIISPRISLVHIVKLGVDIKSDDYKATTSYIAIHPLRPSIKEDNR